MTWIVQHSETVGVLLVAQNVRSLEVLLHSTSCTKYERFVYRDLFERPIASTPGATIEVMNRTSDDRNASFR